MKKVWLAAALSMFSLYSGRPAVAQEYPSRAITLVVPFPAGGAADFVARQIAPRLGARLNQSVVVENKPGATGIIGAQYVARSAPDGYTLLIASSGSHGTLPNVNRNLPFDPIADFSPIGLGARFPLVMVISPKLPVQDLRSFIGYARQQNADVTYGTSGSGSTLHIAGEMFRLATGLNATHVPFRGEALALVEIIGGRIMTAFPAAGGVVAQVRDGTLRPLGVTAANRLPILPEVPTMAEAGLPDFEIGVWYGVAGPARLPAPVVQRLGEELQRVVQEPDFVSRVREQGGEAQPLSPEEFATFISQQIARIGKVTRAANIVLD
jgi:tripartite-type tricarboxylate transporter receptor subunit TctC